VKRSKKAENKGQHTVSERCCNLKCSQFKKQNVCETLLWNFKNNGALGKDTQGFTASCNKHIFQTNDWGNETEQRYWVQKSWGPAMTTTQMVLILQLIINKWLSQGNHQFAINQYSIAQRIQHAIYVGC